MSFCATGWLLENNEHSRSHPPMFGSMMMNDLHGIVHPLPAMLIIFHIMRMSMRITCTQRYFAGTVG